MNKLFISLVIILTTSYIVLALVNNRIIVIDTPTNSRKVFNLDKDIKSAFKNYVTPIIKSFEVEQMKEWGFSIPVNSKSENIEKSNIELLPYKQNEIQNELGYMSGAVKLHGSIRHINSWKPRTILLEFMKLSHDEPWKLFIDHEDIEDAHYKDTLDESIRNLPPKVMVHIKSKFKTIDTDDDFQDGMDAFERKDYKEAFRLYSLSAEHGNADAQNTLGLLYEDGYLHPVDFTIEQDYKEAVKWYRLSAKKGNILGQHGLSSMYEYGRGVDQDYALAHMWLSLSFSGLSKRVDSLNNKKNPSPEDYDAAVPYLRLQYYLLKNGRDYRIVNLEKKMTPSQIEQAQELARNWKPKNIGNTEEIEETTVINDPRYSGEQEEY